MEHQLKKYVSSNNKIFFAVGIAQATTKKKIGEKET